MDRAAGSQGRLHAAWGLPEGGVAINERVWYRDDGDAKAAVPDVYTASGPNWWSAASSMCWTTAGCGVCTCGAGKTSPNVT